MRSFLVFLALLAAGCDSNGIDGFSADLGDAYSLDTRDAARLAPVISDGRLSVPVTYIGGCEDHGFTLRSRIRGDAATVWLEHDANDDACRAVVSETVVAGLPSAVTAAERVVLRAPLSFTGDETTIRLR